MRRILYVGRTGIPVSASGIRIYNIAKVLRKIGYDVNIICDRPDHVSGEVIKKFDGFSYYYNSCSGQNKVLQSINNIYELLSARKIYYRVKGFCEEKKPYAIILYNDVYSLTKRLTKYCKKNDIKLIADVTEWYEKRNSRYIGDKIVPYLTDKRIKTLDRKVNNIISISPYFHRYYLSLGCNSIFVPPIFEVPKDLVIKKYHYYSEYVLNLVYAGFPGSKDILLPILDAISILNKNKIKFRLDLIGISDKYLKLNWKDLNYEKLAIIAHGRLNHETTLQIVRRADFSILLRHDKRYAKAGFSTKFAECMSHGVPMICNRVGGADAIIDSMFNGVVIGSSDVDALLSALNNLLKMDEAQVNKIKINAYAKAMTVFNCANYENALYEFLSK